MLDSEHTHSLSEFYTLADSLIKHNKVQVWCKQGNHFTVYTVLVIIIEVFVGMWPCTRLNGPIKRWQTFCSNFQFIIQFHFEYPFCYLSHIYTNSEKLNFDLIIFVYPTIISQALSQNQLSVYINTHKYNKKNSNDWQKNYLSWHFRKIYLSIIYNITTEQSWTCSPERVHDMLNNYESQKVGFCESSWLRMRIII